MIGATLDGRYDIIEEIGSGGMAIVYKAKCRLLGRYVAIKVLREELRDDKEFVDRFKTEARSAASLNHPNVVSIYDVSKDDSDREYFVMEYIEGITLKELIDSKKLGWKTACSYAVQIAGAIEHAHRKNIVHRDIKPHNIMITKDNVVKVTDFGIARAVTSSTIVRAGNVIGSVHYFSPEQACGGAVDFKSDIYSMGVVLYEMITGQVPFDAENPVAIAKMHVDNPVVPPIELNGEIPEVLNDVVLKAMSKQPAKRYQSPAEMAADLKQVATNPESISVKDNDATQFVPVVKPEEKVYEPKDKIVIKGEEFKEEDKGRKRAFKAVWAIAIVAFVAAVLVVIASFNPSLFGGETIDIPDFRGKTVEEAMEFCEKNGFEFEETEGEYSDKYKAGMIMSQTPKNGTHKKVEKLTVVTSKGLSKITLKDYVGKDIDAVEKELIDLGIQYVINKEEHEEEPIGRIIGQKPSGGVVNPNNTKVEFTVSSGVGETEVPDVLGDTLEKATEKLEEAGLEVTVVYETDNNNVNKVISQSIEEKTKVDKGTEITITVGEKSTDEPNVPDTPVVRPPENTGSGSGAATRD